MRRVARLVDVRRNEERRWTLRRDDERTCDARRREDRRWTPRRDDERAREVRRAEARRFPACDAPRGTMTLDTVDGALTRASGAALSGDAAGLALAPTLAPATRLCCRRL